MVGARHSHILAVDHLSSIPDELSDGLCRIATGGGYGAWQLHTDGDEAVYADKRPILLTSIEDVATRADLADRAIMAALDVLSDTRAPGLLGGEERGFGGFGVGNLATGHVHLDGAMSPGDQPAVLGVR